LSNDLATLQSITIVPDLAPLYEEGIVPNNFVFSDVSPKKRFVHAVPNFEIIDRVNESSSF